MKLAAKVKLITNIEQAENLKETILIANRACNFISEKAWQSKIFGQYNLQKLLYYEVKEKFNLSAQVVIQCIVKVVDAYKLDKKNQRRFKSLGAITYDSRIISWYTNKQFVSIWTIGGRLKISYACGKRQKELLKFQQGETDLVFVNKYFYLHSTCNIEEPEPQDFSDILGIDRGIKNIATLSTGQNFTSNHLLSLRSRYRKIRTRLQKKGTISAKRLLKKRNKKENRFGSHVNHVISKIIVAIAKDTKCAIALENLKGIRTRTTVRKKQRATHHSWGFYQLASFIEYKAKLIGIPVIYVDPRNTSRECFSCGYIDKANRKSQSSFSCVKCGYTTNADINAARVISRRGKVNYPYATSLVS